MLKLTTKQWLLRMVYTKIWDTTGKNKWENFIKFIVVNPRHADIEVYDPNMSTHFVSRNFWAFDTNYNITCCIGKKISQAMVQ